MLLNFLLFSYQNVFNSLKDTTHVSSFVSFFIFISIVLIRYPSLPLNIVIFDGVQQDQICKILTANPNLFEDIEVFDEQEINKYLCIIFLWKTVFRKFCLLKNSVTKPNTVYIKKYLGMCNVWIKTDCY